LVSRRAQEEEGVELVLRGRIVISTCPAMINVYERECVNLP
jgi:hypothetical protein